MKMSHEEYIEKQRKRAAEVASGMLDGSIHYLEGAIELSSLRFEVGLPDDDRDFLVFAGVLQRLTIYLLVRQGSTDQRKLWNGTSQKYSKLLSGQWKSHCQSVNLSWHGSMLNKRSQCDIYSGAFCMPIATLANKNHLHKCAFCGR